MKKKIKEECIKRLRTAGFKYADTFHVSIGAEFFKNTYHVGASYKGKWYKVAVMIVKSHNTGIRRFHILKNDIEFHNRRFKSVLLKDKLTEFIKK